MSHLACPKCRQGISDAALDMGQCPSCGYDGPMVLAGASGKWAWLIATIGVVTIGIALGGYLLYPQQPDRPHATPDRELATAAAPSLLPPAPPPHPVAPHEQLQPSISPTPTPTPNAPARVEPAPPPKLEAIEVVPPPHPVVAPKPAVPKKLGPVVRIDPKEVHEKKLDLPNGVAMVSDLNQDNHLTLTGKVRLLKIGSVSGKATLDTSGLEAEEIVITGDLNDSAVVKLNAPNGKVTIGGHVVGSAKLNVNAPGGELIVAAGSAKLSGGSEVTALVKRLEVNAVMSGGAKMIVTLTADGSAKMGEMQEGATVILKQEVADDPPPRVDPGKLRGRARVTIPGG